MNEKQKPLPHRAAVVVARWCLAHILLT